MKTTLLKKLRKLFDIEHNRYMDIKWIILTPKFRIPPSSKDNILFLQTSKEALNHMLVILVNEKKWRPAEKLLDRFVIKEYQKKLGQISKPKMVHFNFPTFEEVVESMNKTTKNNKI